MKVLNLRCAHDHRFEGWFASEDDFQQQTASGLLLCPVCADATIDRLPTAPRLNMSRGRSAGLAEQAAADEAQAPAPAAAAGRGTELAAAPGMVMQRLWQQAVQHVIANTDDVGERFAEEARRMHYGETDERAIRGKATNQEAEALRDEGIEVMSLPLPPAMKGPLQ
jgi:hypothetical protein